MERHMTTNTPDTLYVENRQQAAIYELEMKGQISDGRWENSNPPGHWRVPGEARVEVRPARIGRNFHHVRGYNFGEQELFDVVSNRMLRYALATIAFPDLGIDRLLACHWDWAESSPSTPGTGPYQRTLALFGVAGADLDRVLDETAYDSGYDLKRLKRDCGRLTTCFRTKIERDQSPSTIHGTSTPAELAEAGLGPVDGLRTGTTSPLPVVVAPAPPSVSVLPGRGGF